MTLQRNIEQSVPSFLSGVNAILGNVSALPKTCQISSIQKRSSPHHLSSHGYRHQVTHFPHVNFLLHVYSLWACLYGRVGGWLYITMHWFSLSLSCSRGVRLPCRELTVWCPWCQSRPRCCPAPRWTGDRSPSACSADSPVPARLDCGSSWSGTGPAGLPGMTGMPAVGHRARCVCVRVGSCVCNQTARKKLVAEWGNRLVEWSKCQGSDITIPYILQILVDDNPITYYSVYSTLFLSNGSCTCIFCFGTSYVQHTQKRYKALFLSCGLK